jgi:hypothetical protein
LQALVFIKKYTCEGGSIQYLRYGSPDAASSKIFDAGFLAAAVVSIALLPLCQGLTVFDFECFWHSAADLWHGVNPYQSSERVISLNSPIGLGLLNFLGLMSYPVAKQLYLFFMVFALLWSLWVGYKKFWSPSHHKILNLSLVALAVPLGLYFQVILWGSMIIFPLLGLCAFYCLDNNKHPFLAGCCLSLCLIKPHLFVLALAWILWWSIKKRQCLLPAGLLSIGIMAILAVLYLQDDIFQMYIDISRHSLFTVSNASVGNLLYRIVPHRHVILLFVPVIVGCCVLVGFRGRLQSLDVQRASAIVLPWSVLLAPYCWGHDYCACFAVVFIAASILVRSLKENKYGLVGQLGLGILLTYIVGMALRLSFNYEKFLAYGVLLACLSASLIMNNYALGVLRNPRPLDGDTGTG